MTPAEIRHWREVRALSQADLARALGCKPPTVSRWEAGERDAPPYLRLALERLARDHRPKRRT